MFVYCHARGLAATIHDVVDSNTSVVAEWVSSCSLGISHAILLGKDHGFILDSDIIILVTLGKGG